MTTQTIERPVQRPPAADLEALFPGRYLSVTTFKRDGTPVATPVWAVSDGSRLYAFTDLHSGKIKRIRHNPHVLVASCWVNGKLRREPVSGRAGVLTEIADLERVRNLLLARYKISYRVVMLFHRLGRRLRRQQSVADGAALIWERVCQGRRGSRRCRGGCRLWCEARVAAGAGEGTSS